MTIRYSTDIVIFGGGIAGLWLLNVLRDRGYDAVLLECNRLGAGQTLASQGIIHGGLKYALNGTLTGAAQAIAAMPARWRKSLAGSQHPDLSRVRILSEHYYMWSDAGLRSRLKSFLGSKSLRGRVDAVAQADYPEFFRRARGTLYRLPDFVVDTASLLRELQAPVAGNVFRIDPEPISFGPPEESGRRAVKVQYEGQDIELRAQRLLFSAGEGNRRLIAASGLESAEAQERPLHMVYLARHSLPDLYVHCIGDSFSLTPRLTITTHHSTDGETVWYLGGELAEAGVERGPGDQIEAARSMLESQFPWLDLEAARWGSFLINRAEARISSHFRPDDALIVCEDNVIVAWPTKLTLTPVLADKVIESLQESNIRPNSQADPDILRKSLPTPELARSQWD